MAPDRSDYLHPIRQRIIDLARIWDEESVEPAEDFADALLDALGLTYVGQWCPWKGDTIHVGGDQPDPHKWQRLYTVDSALFGRTGDTDV